ncbi:hypothetical protein ACFWPU_00785 [Streptomyces sp. NPDC058471]|uniref:hypothetical protein n=1 Tax=Streptomyces sp. NPDC058471 TaxID=3346516 RepID=UPI00364C1360
MATVTSREVLIRSVYQTLSQNEMEALVDDFAHELAEEIRADCMQQDYTGCNCDEEGCTWCDAKRYFAALIDPTLGSRT